MVISVLERRAETGLRRSLGATRGPDPLQFLADALLLSALGGVGAVVLGIAVTGAYAVTQNWPAIVPPWASAWRPRKTTAPFCPGPCTNLPRPSQRADRAARLERRTDFAATLFEPEDLLAETARLALDVLVVEVTSLARVDPSCWTRWCDTPMRSAASRTESPLLSVRSWTAAAASLTASVCASPALCLAARTAASSRRTSAGRCSRKSSSTSSASSTQSERASRMRRFTWRRLRP